MEVADTEAAVTLVEATSAAVTLLGGTSVVGVASAEAGTMCTLPEPMCTSAGPMFTSPETASGVMAAVGVAVGVMAEPMRPRATRTGKLIRTAPGRNELKPMGVLNAHLASHERSRPVTSVLGP
jgi:hypothetical protein